MSAPECFGLEGEELFLPELFRSLRIPMDNLSDTLTQSLCDNAAAIASSFEEAEPRGGVGCGIRIVIGKWRKQICACGG